MNNSNTKTSSLSVDGLNKALETLRQALDEDGAIIPISGHTEYENQMIKFVQWLRKQDDVPEKIKIDAEILTVMYPVSPEFAKQFEPYLYWYNKENGED